MGQNNTNGSSCKSVCWLVALVAGVLVAALLMSMRHFGFLPAAFWGLVTLIIGGFLLNWAFCGKSETQVSSSSATTGSTTTSGTSSDSSASAAPLASTGDATTSSSASSAAAAGATAAVAATAASAEPKVKPSAELAGEADVASRKGEWKYEPETKAEAPAKKPAAKKAAAKKPAAKKPAAKKATASKASATKTAAKSSASSATTTKAEPKAKAAAKPKAATKAKTTEAKPAAKAKAAPKAKAAAAKPAVKAKAAPKAKAAASKTKAAPKAKSAAAAKPAAKSKAKPVAADGKPELLKKARAGGADDLKQIKGVGPKLEGELNKQGVYHFDQVASWRKKEVEWADINLEGVKGRVSRDEWVKQAKVLAKGGETEFSKKVKKGGVY